MEVKYERPTLDTKFEVPYDYSFLRVGSVDDVKRMQEKLLDITDQAAKFLKGYNLPDEIGGEALITLRGYNAKMKRRHFFDSKTVGVVGFPNISIDTSLGRSDLSLNPEQDSMFYHIGNHPLKGYGNHIQISISGGGLADKVAQEILSKVEANFSTRPVKVETFGEHQPLYKLSKRIIVPI